MYALHSMGFRGLKPHIAQILAGSFACVSADVKYTIIQRFWMLEDHFGPRWCLEIA